MKQKTNRLHFSTRTLAMVLSIVMLIGSIATGSMLSTFAAYLKDAAANSDAVSQAASEGSDIALNAIPSDEDSADDEDAKEAPDLSRLRENSIVKRLKQDLTATGANVDLAASGSPNYISYGYKADGNRTTLSSNKVSGASITFTSENSQDYYFVSASDDGNYYSSMYSNAYPGYSYSGFTNNAGGNGNNNHSYNDGKINWVESYNAVVSGIKLQVVSGTTVTVTYNNGVYEVTATSGGGTTPTEAPTTAPTSAPTVAPTAAATTTDTADKTSGKTLLVDYDAQHQRSSAHIWNVISGNWQDDLTPSSYTNLYYGFLVDDGLSSESGYDTNKAIYFIIKNKDNWTNQSEDIKPSNYKVGKQWYYYCNSDGSTHNNDEYTPLTLTSVDRPSRVIKGVANSFTVNVEGGVPWFFKEKMSDSTKNYTLSVGTSSGGNQVVNAQTFNYSAKKLDFSWTPTSSGSVTLYYTLTDGIDTVTYSKAYTVEVLHDVTFSAGTGGSISPSGSVAVSESTATTVTATADVGYAFSSWTNGSGITQVTNTADGDNQTQTITTKSSGDYTVQANFTKKNYTVSYTSTTMEDDHGTFTVTNDSTAVASGTSLPYETPLTVTCTPDTGYEVDYVKVNDSDEEVTLEGNTATFIVPADDAVITVAFKKSDLSISKSTSPAGKGTITVSKTSGGSNTTTYQVGDTLYLSTSVSDNAYTVSSYTLTYGDGTRATIEGSTGNTGAIDATHFGTDGSISIIANLTKKPTHKVTVVSNNNSYGTATASVTEAYEGQTVTLTPKEDTGSFSSWSVTSGGVTVSNNTFTMGSSDVAITATFVAYSGTSNFYYNSYGSDGQPASSRYGAQMQKAKIGGVEYSYYHVSGRTESDQLFTVSYGSPKYNSKQAYFEIWSSWESGGVQAQFYTTDGKNLGDYTGMTYDTEANEKKKFKIQIPDGACSVQFKHGGSTTGKLSMTSGCNAWYTNNKNGTLTDVTGYGSDNPVPNGFLEYFNSTKYTDAFDSKGFWEHNANRGESHAYTKPKDLGAYSSNYYVLVLEKDKTYTINGVTKKITNDPEIIWLPELPDSGDTIKVYAKDGAIRSGLKTYGDMADTTVLKADGTTSAVATSYGSDNQTYEVYKAQPGETIVIQTTIANTVCDGSTETYRDRFYVRGFSINGEVPQLLEPNNTGVYTQRYTVPEDYEDKYVEITPIYFLKDTTNNPVVTFRATNFPKGQHNWGNVPYCYPFYGNLSDKDNAFGAYPGQPLIFFKGNYSMQVPVKSTSPFSDDGANTNVAGITMSNGYYDDVHKLIMGYGDNSTSADHVQTYDYGDFWKIFNEKKPVDNIVFDFKYKDTKHNLIDDTTGDSIAKSTLTDKYTNGFELLKNFHGRNVDLFGKALSGDAADPTKTPAVYVVSIGGINDGVGGVENIAGFYATEWRVYAPNDKTSVSTTYKKMSSGDKSSIPPEVLVLNDDDDTSFNNTTYPSAVDKPSKSYKVTDWKSLYQALEDYRDLPVYISYEAADAQEGAEDYKTGTHGATRNDGRWLYSKNNESITGKIRIDVSQDQGATYTPNGNLPTPVEGINAYFTNDGVEGEKTYATTSDPDKTFNFEAKTTNGEYKFMGWYLDDEHSTKITGDNIGFTERFQSQTFVARFMHVTSGQLILSHTAETNETYKGIGTVSIGAVVKNEDGSTYKTYAPSTSDITLDDKIVTSDSDQTVEVTLTATRSENGNNGTTILDTPSGQESTFFDYGNFTLSEDGKTRTFSFEFPVSALFTGETQTVKNLIYHSYFTQFIFNYVFKFEAPMRDGSTKYYFKDGTLTPKQIENYVIKKYNEQTRINDRYITKDFVESIAPFESNFATDVTWLIGDDYKFTVTSDVYNVESFVLADSASDNKFDVTFNLPYDHTNGVATLNADGSGTYNASAENFSLIKDGATDNRVTLGEIPKLLETDENGVYSEADKSKWIVAPTKLSNGDFFQYWSITRTSDKIEVARCYYPGFNFAALDNYEITAKYGDTQTDLANSGVSTSVTYLETTRNQWNSSTSESGQMYAPDVNKTTNPNDYQAKAADMLYNDFVLSYNYNGVFISEDTEGAAGITDLGLVVERVKELNTFDDGSYDTNIASYTGIAQKTNDVKATATQNNQQTDINGTRYYKSTVAKSELDNKNRILFYDAFFNTAGWNHEKQKPVYGYTYKKYVYRAYSYITYNDNGTPTTVLSETPAYFIMYDVATADYKSN